MEGMLLIPSANDALSQRLLHEAQTPLK